MQWNVSLSMTLPKVEKRLEEKLLTMEGQEVPPKSYPGSEEWKEVVTVHNFGQVPPTGLQTASLNVIRQGTASFKRIGNTVTLKEIQIRMIISLNRLVENIVLPNSDILRVIVFVDKQANGVATAFNDVLNTFGGQRILQPYNRMGNERIVILWDQYYEINYQALSLDSENLVSLCSVKQFDLLAKPLNIPIHWSDANEAGAIDTILSNNIGLMVFSKNGEAKLDYVSRILYEDN